jgi:uncharacterized protein YigA (DUF484 family)
MSQDAAHREIEELRRRVSEMTAEAAQNEAIMKRMQTRELLLLRADKLSQLLRAMVDGLKESYALDAVSVVLLDPQHEIRHLLVASGDRPEDFRQVFFVDSLVGLAPQLTALHKPWLGPFVGADLHLLFPGVRDLKSTALVPLPRADRAIGALCFGSRDITAPTFSRISGRSPLSASRTGSIGRAWCVPASRTSSRVGTIAATCSSVSRRSCRGPGAMAAALPA